MWIRGMLVSIAGGKGMKSGTGTLEVVFGISWNNLDDVLYPDAELAVLVIAGLIRQDHPSLQPCNTPQLPIQFVPLVAHQQSCGLESGCIRCLF
jgi:hypothetical protein